MGNIKYGFDRKEFLLKIVGQFNTKSDRVIIDRVYNQMLTELEKQRSPYNQMDITEKIKILKECYRSFRSDEFRQGLKGTSPRKIAQDFGEEMLGILKRKYDMSSMFSPGLVGSRKLPDGTMKKMVGIRTLPDNDERTIVNIEDEKNVTIQQIGELIYSDGIDIISDIKQYVVLVPDNRGKSIERTILTKEIDFDLLSHDKNYSDAVFSELLNVNNIEHSNAGGYIGEIIRTNKMVPGEEKEDESGFYTYQSSENYAITFDPIVVTASKILETRKKTKEIEGR